jgi:acyl carrier protein
MSSIAEKVKEIIVDQLGVAADDVKPEASFVEDLGADSLDLTELIMAMEEAFSVEIADEDAQKILKVQDAYDYIEKNKK